jgi:arylsulfatase A-like enzyme
VPTAPGRSFAASLKKDVPIAHDYLWWEHEGNRAIRVGDWKLVALAKGEWELYDLARDRGEAQNLAEKNPAKVRELATLWTDHFDLTVKLALSAPPPDLPSPASKKAKSKSK